MLNIKARKMFYLAKTLQKLWENRFMACYGREPNLPACQVYSRTEKKYFYLPVQWICEWNWNVSINAHGQFLIRKGWMLERCYQTKRNLQNDFWLIEDPNFWPSMANRPVRVCPAGQFRPLEGSTVLWTGVGQLGSGSTGQRRKASCRCHHFRSPW